MPKIKWKDKEEFADIIISDLKNPSHEANICNPAFECFRLQIIHFILRLA